MRPRALASWLSSAMVTDLLKTQQGTHIEFLAEARGLRIFAISEGKDHRWQGIDFAHRIDGLTRRCTCGDRILDDRDLLARFEIPLDAAASAMTLGLLAHKKGMQVLPGQVGQRGDCGGDGICTEGEAAHRGDFGMGLELMQDESGDEIETLRMQRDLLAIDIEGRTLAGSEDDIEAVTVGSLPNEFEEPLLACLWIEAVVHGLGFVSGKREPLSLPPPILASMSEKSEPVSAELYAYLAARTSQEDSFLAKLKLAARAAEIPSIWISPEQAAMMQILLKLKGARDVIEVGTLAGYSAITMARALGPAGRVRTIEFEDRHADFAEKWIADSDVAGRIQVLRGDGRKVLPEIADESADAAFVDADKSGYATYLQHCLRILRPGGLMMVDNAFAFGSVLEKDPEDASVRAIQDFNETMAACDELQSLILPIGDGCWVGVKRDA